MKWFKHHSDSHGNLKVGAVLAEYGVKGYGLWWLCVELVANQGDDYTVGADKNWKRWLMSQSKLTKEEIDGFLGFFASERLIDEVALTEAQLHIPKLADYCNDYENRKERGSNDGVRTKTKSVRTITKNVPLEVEKKRKEVEVSLFDRMWGEYPKKVGKQEARSAFEKLKPTPELTDRIISAIALWKQTSQWQDNEGRYIPHCSTFLNKRRFEDELPDALPAPKAIKI